MAGLSELDVWGLSTSFMGKFDCLDLGLKVDRDDTSSTYLGLPVIPNHHRSHQYNIYNSETYQLFFPSTISFRPPASSKTIVQVFP
jgi:hypothetical protein